MWCLFFNGGVNASSSLKGDSLNWLNLWIVEAFGAGADDWGRIFDSDSDSGRFLTGFDVVLEFFCSISWTTDLTVSICVSLTVLWSSAFSHLVGDGVFLVNLHCLLHLFLSLDWDWLVSYHLKVFSWQVHLPFHVQTAEMMVSVILERKYWIVLILFWNALSNWYSSL